MVNLSPYDFVITPIYFFFLYLFFLIGSSKYRKEPLYKKYFVRSFLFRILGGLSFALIYLFYYDGGDTINYFIDSKMITEILYDHPLDGLVLIFSNQTITRAVYPQYVGVMVFPGDPSALIVSKMAALFNVVTFNSFLCDTILFSLFGFWGSWRLFLTMARIYPTITRQIGTACLFIPSVFFWGSGIMKDTLCIALICYIVSITLEITVFKERSPWKIIMLVIYCYLLIGIKIYIFMCLTIPILILVILSLTKRIKSLAWKIIVYPILIPIGFAIGYYVIDVVSEDNAKYDLDKIEQTSKITRFYIDKMTKKTDGSSYDIGNVEFTITNIPLLFTRSFIVTFYRPYLWEIRNPLMILSSLEGIFFMYLSYSLIKVLFKSKKKMVFTPFVIFCIIFVVIFSFIVGVTSANFGTLARYKIPLLPFFVIVIYILIHQAKSKYDNI